VAALPATTGQVHKDDPADHRHDRRVAAIDDKMAVVVNYSPTISARSYGIYVATESPILEERIVFDWDEHNIAHIDRHGVRLMEAEGALSAKG